MNFLAYAILCVIVGMLGNRTQIGFWGFFFLSFLFTPFVGLVLVMVGRPRGVPKTTIQNKVVHVHLEEEPDLK
ncbi:hypothetical protein [Acanthopleuribacter pedis]|uniref:Transmembrane protein n=1 Tax=Acanthopleuribacter pedis TaxID=442870 RepID=A0A8J7Q108_9BACT|nr:hypothetical protein [Acanthopleuribacter pedis]MBO1318427.1 hypothetical protein [Acanthopleuribacter pedis]